MDRAITLQGQALTMRFRRPACWSPWPRSTSPAQGRGARYHRPNGRRCVDPAQHHHRALCAVFRRGALEGELLTGQPAHRIVAKGIARTPVEPALR